MKKIGKMEKMKKMYEEYGEFREAFTFYLPVSYKFKLQKLKASGIFAAENHAIIEGLDLLCKKYGIEDENPTDDKEDKDDKKDKE